MKKLVILLLPTLFILTGCFGLAGQGYLTNTCTKQELSSTLEETDSYVVNFKSGIVNEIVVSNSFKSVNDSNIDYIDSVLKTYSQTYSNMTGVKVELDTLNKTIKYTFDMNKVSDEIKEKFNLNSKYNDQISKLKDLGMTCK